MGASHPGRYLLISSTFGGEEPALSNPRPPNSLPDPTCLVHCYAVPCVYRRRLGAVLELVPTDIRLGIFLVLVEHPLPGPKKFL